MEAYVITPTFGRDILLQYILFSKCREDLLTEEKINTKTDFRCLWEMANI